MKILTVCQHYYPENFQVTPICEQFVKDGHEVTALVGLPNYPKGYVPEEYKHGKRREEVINGVKVIRCMEIGRRHGSFWLAMNYLSFFLSSKAKVRKLGKNFDVVFMWQSSPITMAAAGIKYAKKYKKPSLLYTFDQWPVSLKIYIKNERNPIYRIMDKVSKHIYRSATTVVCQSSSFIDYLSKTHGLNREEILYIPTFADESYLEADFTPEDNVITDFVFLGNVGKAQNLFRVLDAVKMIEEVPNFQVHIVGDGTSLYALKEYSSQKGLDNIVKFYGHRAVEEMSSFYKLADACILSLIADNEIGYTLPGKLQGYMAAGKPVLGMIDGSAAQVIKESKCGVCVPSNDTTGFAKAMKDFIETPDKYKDCGNNARKYFKKNFRKRIVIDKLEQEFERLISEN